MNTLVGLEININFLTLTQACLNLLIFQGLQALRCPPGLAFDLEKQTCDWKWAVKNCDMITKDRKVQPLLNTPESLCDENLLACGDGVCMEKGLFCNGIADCADGSDENACGKSFELNALNFQT